MISEGKAGLESGGPETDRRSQVSALPRPLESDTLKLPLFDQEPEGESEREGRRSRRVRAF